MNTNNYSINLYIGISDTNNNLLKIGYTEQTCWARCRRADYTIFGACSLIISSAEALFIESYLRLAFNAMAETKQQIRQDYFLINEDFSKDFSSNEEYLKWAFTWFKTFVYEAIAIVNLKRSFTNQNEIWDSASNYGMVTPYTY